LIMQRLDVPQILLDRVRGLRAGMNRPDQAWTASIEAYVSWRANDLPATLEHLEDALEHASAGRPVHLACVTAFGRLFEVALDLHLRRQDDVRSRRALLAARKVFKQVAAIFPVARPMLALHSGALLYARGKRKLAFATWISAVRPARAMGLPHHEARLHEALATTLPETRSAKALHAQVADRLERSLV